MAVIGNAAGVNLTNLRVPAGIHLKAPGLLDQIRFLPDHTGFLKGAAGNPELPPLVENIKDMV
jgi:hypothetical protein